MIRLIGFIIHFALAIGVGEAAVHMVMDMAGRAAHAQQFDRVSYLKWNQILWQKPKYRGGHPRH